jgi:glycosyltransferase involved in cell wall biosynthesis|tara:strand:- start:869 stop:1948 length:1080 start_codon:yes stop_codon:yes gene_type:complete
MKRILVLCPYPKGEAAGQRFKYEQYFSSWEKEGYSIKVSSFFDKSTWDILYKESNLIKKVLGTLRGYLRRVLDILFLNKYDVIYVFMWVTPLGPPFFERLAKMLGKKLIYDFDDSVFLEEDRPQSMNLNLSKTYQKSQYLIKYADHVILSSPFNLEFCLKENLRSSATYIPCSINTERFNQRKERKTYDEKLVLGWTGTFSSVSYLNLLKDILISLNKDLDFKLLLITNFDYSFDEIDLEVIRWNEETEIEDLQRIDIGLYPLSEDKWSLGKGGLKVMQYMSIGVPSVATNHGTACNIISQGESGFLVNTEEEWIKALKNLIEDGDLRYKMGVSARKSVVENYSTNAIERCYLELLEQL